MKKLKLSTREIGTVIVFDLQGDPTEETFREVAAQIQKKIRKHRIQRVILNLQELNEVDPIGMRKLMAACLRPQKSLIYGADDEALKTLSDSYLPQNVRVCSSEEEVAEDFGPFLLEKEADKEVLLDVKSDDGDSIGQDMERRRSKRMHVAIPVELTLYPESGDPLCTKAIITNISEGGMFAEYLDIHQAARIGDLVKIENTRVDIRIPKCANFPEEYQVKGEITRKEMRKRQLGIAVKFTDK